MRLDVTRTTLRQIHPGERDTVFEFYVVPPFRRHASALFAALLAASRVARVECQSNDLLLSSLLFEFARDVNADEVVGTGGFLLHYNPPFADVYMEVAAPHRRRGVGSFLVQGVIRECFLAGRVPAARCALENVGSRATLTRAGLRVCGYMLAGRVPHA
jgi:RimJ/RimL family protein N-acetyltransferase